MLFGYEVSRPNGSIMTNGLTRGGVLVDVLICPAGNSSSRSYPRTHKSGLSYCFARAGAHQITLVDQVGADGSVQGTVKWDWVVNGWQQDTVLYVFAKKLDSLDLFGIQLTNDAGEIFADPTYPAPQWAGTVQLGAAASMSYTTPDGYTASVHQATVNLRSGADKMVLMCLPDVGTSDTWYHLRKEYILAADGATTVEVVVYTKAASYILPSLHVYAVNSPLSSVSPFTVSVETATHQTTYDAAVEGFSGVDELQLQYVGYGSTTSYSLPAGYTLGMSVPYYKRSARVANGSRFDEIVEVSAGKRVGTQLTLSIIRDSFRTVATSSMATYTVGGTQLRYSPVADVSQLTPSSITGTPASPLSSAPVFNSFSGSTSVHPGDVASFTVAVSGYPAPSLQWYLRGSAVTGQTGATFRTTASLSDDGSSVYCVATNGLGVTQTDTAYLYVNNVVAPTITSSTGNLSPTVGTTERYAMTASGSPTPYCEILGPGGISASGYGSCSITVTVTSAMSGSLTYRATVTDGSFTAVTESHNSMTAQSPTPAQPVFSTNPSSQSVVQGGSVSLYATASPADSYAWLDANYTQVGTGQSYSPPTSTVGSFTYRCRAYNGSSYQDSSPATITVTAAQAPTTYTSYYDGSPYTDSQTGTVTWGASGDYTDSGPWHSNSPGDNSLYDIWATGATGTSEGAALNTWYSMASGASWYIAATSSTRTKRLSFTYQIRLRSTGSIVSSGTVSLTSTYGVAA